MKRTLDEGALQALYRELAAHSAVCGIDEVGRGPIAGPVVACAIIMDKGDHIPGVRDSKKLSEKKRELLYAPILERARAWGIGQIEAELIDAIDIRQATLLAMKQALEQLCLMPDAPFPDLVVVDAETIDTPLPQIAVVHGDDLIYEISCASIIAKVTRDRQMIAYGKQHPEYGFERHKGYGTKAHYEAIERYGLLPLHRRSFLKGRESSWRKAEKTDG
uniref:ribonuclease HII n=1 Tax=Ndongobacter massiliensis TaxID=1871025 RepID=UPI0009308079|nr:ribonuclease HII [Ndongobacter massiliensis]